MEGAKRGAGWAWLFVLLAGCGASSSAVHLEGAAAPAPEAAAPAVPPEVGHTPQARPEALLGVAGRPAMVRPLLEPLEFLPAFHQALRWSYQTPGLVTLRFKVPVAREGGRLKVAFTAGDGPLRLHRASVGKAGEGGALAGPAVPLRFGGQAGAELQARQRVVSEPAAFAVSRWDELYVSFVVEGHLAASAIDAFPDSFIAWGDQAFGRTLHDEAARQALTGLTTIEVEGPRERVLVAIGDSITEGYVSGADDSRNAWPHVAGRLLALPVLNGAVSGQGVWAANHYLEREVGVLDGLTDCLVLLGTNDLGAKTPEEMQQRLSTLFDNLRGRCRVWAGTLLPKESSGGTAELELVNWRRREVNAWLRTGAEVDEVIDFEAAVRDPEDPDRFAEGYAEDSIHPSVEGHRALGQAAAAAIRSR